jgi:hypothetical protein
MRGIHVLGVFDIGHTWGEYFTALNALQTCALFGHVEALKVLSALCRDLILPRF